jgi:hypothetical protein
MKNFTPLFPNFHLQTLRRTPRSAQQILAAKLTQLKQKSFSQLGACLGKFIPAEHLHPTPSGPLIRRRFFSKENTFWAFFSQVLDADGGCQEVVRKLQAFAALKSTVLPSSPPPPPIAKPGKSLISPVLRLSCDTPQPSFRADRTASD